MPDGIRSRIKPRHDVTGIIIANGAGQFLTCTKKWAPRDRPGEPETCGQQPYVFSIEFVDREIERASDWIAAAAQAWHAVYDHQTDSTRVLQTTPMPFSTLM